MRDWRGALLDYMRHLDRPQTVDEIRKGLKKNHPWKIWISRSAVYSWLREQERKGLVRRRRDGQPFVYRWRQKNDLLWPPW